MNQSVTDRYIRRNCLFEYPLFLLYYILTEYNDIEFSSVPDIYFPGMIMSWAEPWEYIVFISLPRLDLYAKAKLNFAIKCLYFTVVVSSQ